MLDRKDLIKSPWIGALYMGGGIVGMWICLLVLYAIGHVLSNLSGPAFGAVIITLWGAFIGVFTYKFPVFDWQWKLSARLKNRAP